MWVEIHAARQKLGNSTDRGALTYIILITNLFLVLPTKNPLLFLTYTSPTPFLNSLPFLFGDIMMSTHAGSSPYTITPSFLITFFLLLVSAFQTPHHLGGAITLVYLPLLPSNQSKYYQWISPIFKIIWYYPF